MIRNFITALQFLTIFPISRKHEITEANMAKSMAYFPLIGFILGVFLIYVDKALSLAFPHTIANALLLVVFVLATRALHIDGLADTFDAVMGGYDKASRLRIMKDSGVGTAGALGIFFVLLVKYLCLNELPLLYKAEALLTAPLLSRWSHILMAFRAKYGRDEGMGRAFVGHLRLGGVIAASIATILLTAWISGLWTIYLVIGVALFTFLIRLYAVRMFGGVTGDVIGAVSEMNEVLILLLFVALSMGG